MTREETYFKFYDELPPPIAEAARRNYYSGYSYAVPTVLADAINCGFSFACSPEGCNFWLCVRLASRKGVPQYPKLPTT